MPLPTAAFSPTHSSEHNTYYVAPELNIQHNLNQQAHNTMNNIEWNQPLTPSYLLQCWTPHAAVHNLNSWRWTYRCPKHVELFMMINHNCYIKLVPLVIFTFQKFAGISNLLSVVSKFQPCTNHCSKCRTVFSCAVILCHLHATNSVVLIIMCLCTMWFYFLVSVETCFSPMRSSTEHEYTYSLHELLIKMHFAYLLLR